MRRASLALTGVTAKTTVDLYASPVGTTTPDLKTTYGEDTTARGTMMALGYNSADSPTIFDLPVNGTTSVLLGTAAADRVAQLSGNYVAAGGTFRFQWAQNTSDAGPTTVLRGSYLEWARVPQ